MHEIHPVDNNSWPFSTAQCHEWLYSYLLSDCLHGSCSIITVFKCNFQQLNLMSDQTPSMSVLRYNKQYMNEKKNGTIMTANEQIDRPNDRQPMSHVKCNSVEKIKCHV